MSVLSSAIVWGINIIKKNQNIISKLIFYSLTSLTKEI